MCSSDLIPLWAKFADEFPKESEATSMRVVASQFQWQAIYPGKDGQFGRQDYHLVNTTNQFGWDYTDPLTRDNFMSDLNTIVAPLGKPVVAHITSKDVIHSFKVNAFRITQDAMPGLSIPIWFNPTTNGVFVITCAQLCGNSHYYMKGYFEVVDTNRWDEYVMAQTAKSPGAQGQSFE